MKKTIIAVVAIVLMLSVSSAMAKSKPNGQPFQAIWDAISDLQSGGTQGPSGEDGSDGLDGSDGADGQDGQDGADGEDGISCWDLNENGVQDIAEDANNDNVVDVLDCKGETGESGEGTVGPAGSDGADGQDGQDGADGEDGISCWDLNENGVQDIAEEDINGDTFVDVLDCKGDSGDGWEETRIAELEALVAELVARIEALEAPPA